MLDKIMVFCGKVGSGKSTLANLLYNELVDKGLPCFKVSFATLLKQMLGDLLKADFANSGLIKRFKLKHNSVAWLELESYKTRATNTDKAVLLDFVL